MRLVFVLMILLVTNLAIYSQNNNSKYQELVKQAFKLYESKMYLESARRYMQAFSVKRSQPTMNDRYNAACSWSLASKKDSSFNQLFYISKHNDYSNLNHIQNDSDLNLLHKDQRWSELIQVIHKNKEKVDALLDQPLIALLDEIHTKDQKYRRKTREIDKKYGRKSLQMDTLSKQIMRNDSLNLIEVTKIIDERGWLGPEVIGRKGTMTLFLVIQHADLQTQKKYLPLMKQAVKDNKASASNFALLQDRVAMRSKKKQIYGSQVGRDKESGMYYVFPVKCPKNINKRRAKMNLPPIEDYLSHWNIKWNPIEHKKQNSNRK